MILTRKRAAQTLGVIRLVNGGAALLVPRTMARVMGIDTDEHPQMVYFMRMFGIRTVLLGLHLLSAEGEELERAMRIGIVIHATDTAAAGIALVTGALPRRAAITALVISKVNTGLAVYGSGLVGHAQ